MVGTSMKEPNCPHNWCAISNSVKYFGPTNEDKKSRTTTLNQLDVTGEF